MPNRYIIFVIDGPENLAAANEIVMIDAFNDTLQKNGNWVAAAGIMGPDKATVFDNRGGKQHVVEVSIFQSPEHYSGFWLIQAESIDEARELALEGSMACNRRVELRPYIR